MPIGKFRDENGEVHRFRYAEGQDKEEAARLAYERLKQEREGTFGDRFRELSAGLTFEFGDEIEAGFKTGFGTNGDYKTKRDEIRAEMAKFRDNNRGEALGWNIAGSLPTALIPGLGMARAAQGASRLAKVGQGALLGAGEGALAGLGASDAESAGQMALDTGVGMGFGAGVGGSLGGLLAGKINRGIQSGVNKIENMPSTAVQGELKDILGALNMSPEEVVRHIESGKLMAEMPALAPYINAAMGEGKTARQLVEEVYRDTGTTAGRGRRLANEAEDSVYETLTGSTNKNQIDAQLNRAAEMQEGVGPAYQRAAQTEITDQSFIDQMVELYRRFPEARAKLETLAQENNIVPAFREALDGAITPNRVPSVGDADQLMRFLRELKSSRYRAGDNELGKSAGDAYGALRRDLDNLAPELADSRRQVRSAKTMEQGFKDFDSAPGGDVTVKDARRTKQERILGQSDESEMMGSYMEGARAATSKQIANALRNMSSGGQETIRKLLSDSTNQGMLLRMVSEGKDIGPLLQKLDNAADARQAQQALLGNSKTAAVQMAQKNMATSVNADEALSAMAGNPAALANLANKVSAKVQRRIKPKEIDEVIKVLLDPNPESVKRVLVGSPEKVKVNREILSILQQVLMAAPAKAGQDVSTAAQLEYN
jgi:hypothetical protein